MGYQFTIFFTSAFLPGSFSFEIDPFLSLYFFFRIYFLVLSLPQECSFWLIRDICDKLWSFFPCSLRLRYKKQMQQVSPSPLLRLSSFPNSYCELFTMSHIHCAHILYISSSRVPSFLYIMTNWVDMRALMFPWIQEPGWSDSAPSQGRPGPVFAFLLPLAQWHPGRGAEACGPERAVAHSGQRPHLGSCVFMQLRHTIATRLDVAAVT